MKSLKSQTKRDSIAWIGILTLVLIAIALLTVFKTSSKPHSSAQTKQDNSTSQSSNFLNKNETSTKTTSFLLRDKNTTLIQPGGFILTNKNNTSIQQGSDLLHHENERANHSVSVLSPDINVTLPGRLPELHNSTDNRTSWNQLNNTDLEVTGGNTFSEQGNDAFPSYYIPNALHIVYFGNSMIFKNDCPGVIEKMILESTQIYDGITANVTQDKCLVGGATLTSLWNNHQSCDVLKEFVSRNDNSSDAKSIAEFIPHRYHDWDYVILNDQSQGPARESSRSMSIETIKTKYAPLFLLNVNKTTPIPIIIQTAAYRYRGIQDSGDIGNFDNFTDAIAAGVREYQKSFNEVLLSSVSIKSSSTPDTTIANRGARIAPVGEAYRYLRRTKPQLYEKLYKTDNFHPSAYGTWLEACVIFITCFQREPPRFHKRWMSHHVNSTDIPSSKEASTLRDAACIVTGYC